ncbi:MAG: AbrB/MazE/SpoVT family DNA-binding domain-containing protein [Firmicutes bacterium]|nr:AbrB/MazE/SpoVT family DNA-binding domain-containing protein [Bacillota bacterium]
MKATGIVRRIDDLGRVVIPKEIRRSMRIREGDPLEIFVERDGQIILKKYSPIGELAAMAKEYAEAMNETLGQPVLISDRDNFIAVSGAAKKDFLGKQVGRLVERSMEERRICLENDGGPGGGGIIAGDAGEERYRFRGQLAAPIIAQGDPVGAVVICGNNALGDSERKVAQSAAGVMARQMEQ